MKFRAIMLVLVLVLSSIGDAAWAGGGAGGQEEPPPDPPDIDCPPLCAKSITPEPEPWWEPIRIFLASLHLI